MKDMRRLTRWSFALSALCVLLLHILKPDFNIKTRNLSEYANGDFGILMILAFILFAFGLLGMAFYSYRTITEDRLRVIFSFLFVVSAFSSVIMGLFPVTLHGTPSNTSSVIHMQTAPIFLLSVISSMTLFTFRLQKEKDGGQAKRIQVFLAITTWSSLILTLLVYGNADHQGWVQRIFATSLWVWIMYTSVQLRKSQ